MHTSQVFEPGLNLRFSPGGRWPEVVFRVDLLPLPATVWEGVQLLFFRQDTREELANLKECKILFFCEKKIPTILHMFFIS